MMRVALPLLAVTSSAEASQRVKQPPAATKVSPPQEDPFQSKEDWWMDPLAMFDEDDNESPLTVEDSSELGLGDDEMDDFLLPEEVEQNAATDAAELDDLVIPFDDDMDKTAGNITPPDTSISENAAGQPDVVGAAALDDEDDINMDDLFEIPDDELSGELPASDIDEAMVEDFNESKEAEISTTGAATEKEAEAPVDPEEPEAAFLEENKVEELEDVEEDPPENATGVKANTAKAPMGNRAVRFVSNNLVRLVSSIPPSDMSVIEIPADLSSLDEFPGERRRPVNKRAMILSAALAKLPAGPILQAFAALAIGSTIVPRIVAKWKKARKGPATDLVEEDEEEYEGVGYPMDSDNGSYLSESEEESFETANATPEDSIDEDLDDLGIAKKPPSRFPFWRGKNAAPSAKDLLGQLQLTRDKCREILQDKESTEKLYETTSWQLQEAQSEMSALKQTTNLLQAQLREQEDMQERIAASEKRKAQEELARMKEAMVKVIKRERENMREEFLKQANELQAMWREEQNNSAPNYPWKRKGRVPGGNEDDDDELEVQNHEDAEEEEDGEN